MFSDDYSTGERQKAKRLESERIAVYVNNVLNLAKAFAFVLGSVAIIIASVRF